MHLHTFCSDGLYSPQETLEEIVAAGIEVAAITDHETGGGYLAVKDEVPDGTRLIFGVEFSTYHKEAGEPGASGTPQQGAPDAVCAGPQRAGEIHILGYFPGGVTGEVQAFLKELQQERVNRAKVTLVNLRKNGCKLSFDTLMEQVHGDCISRAHMARALVANGLVSSTYEAFNRYLGISHGIVPPPLLTPKRAIAFIGDNGGVPVWAHPELDSFDLHVKEFVDSGLKGVEVCCRKRTEAYSFYFERTARVLGLLVTYGTDWHGFSKKEITGMTVPYKNVAEFLELFQGRQ